MEQVEKKKVGRPPKRIVDYIVVWDVGHDVFERIVKTKITEGYIPVGGVSYAGFSPEGIIVLLQAMIKER